MLEYVSGQIDEDVAICNARQGGNLKFPILMRS
jgi:hypothetical protein